ncbi:MAG: hypothetical protein ABIJ59_09140 [Pseudomonadota bacterium]
MKINIEVNNDVILKFPFENFMNRMIAIVPATDIVGLDKIVIKNEVSKEYQKQNDIVEAFYYQDNEKKKNHIEVFIKNILNRSIPEYAFNIYPEIGGLLLSEIIYHEIGHHVHFNRRHGVKKKKYEKFAKKYSTAGYYLYFKTRAPKILSNYKWASWNFFLFNKKERQLFKQAKDELITWVSKTQNDIVFP